MANNYTPSYNQYRTQTAGYALPSSVRTYSVFDPASNTWRRMTNDGMSPMPQGNQADIQAALAQARQTQGTVYPAQGMGQGQPVEVHPGYLNPPAQGVNISPRQATRPLAKNASREQSSNVYADIYASHAGEDPRAPLNQPVVQLSTVPENAVAFGGVGKTPEGTIFTTPNADTSVTRVATETNTNGWTNLANRARDFVSPLAVQGASILVNPAAGVGGAIGGAVGKYAVPATKVGLGLLNPALGIPMLAKYLSK